MFAEDSERSKITYDFTSVGRLAKNVISFILEIFRKCFKYQKSGLRAVFLAEIKKSSDWSFVINIS